MEPLSIVTITGAVGGASGAFSKEVWDTGKNWIAAYFKDHTPKAIEKAEQNSLDFLAQLAQRVNILEEEGEQQKKIIEDSLNNPDFSILLQKAVISSAQTEDKQKHELLARLVADRLSKGSETLFALTSQSACDAISRMNTIQMKILGCLATVHFIRPKPYTSAHMQGKDLEDWWVKWLTEKLTIYRDIAPAKMDYLHLESLSCIKWNEKLTYDFDVSIYTPANVNPYAFTRTKIGGEIFQLWYGDFGKTGLSCAYPTTAGILIGIYVSDMLLGTTTTLDEWDKA